MKMSNSRLFFTKKRTLVIVAAVLIVCAVVGLWVGAGVHQGEVQQRIDAQHAKAKTAARHVSTGSEANRDTRLGAITVLSGSDKLSDCEGAWWASWRQVVLPSAKAAVKECGGKVERLNVVAKAATELKSYLDDDTKVAKTLLELRMSSSSDTWQKTALVSAETTLRALESMPATRDNQQLLSTSKDKVKTIAAAWNTLNKASAKEDKTAYLKAKDELVQAYANLGAISDVSDERVLQLTKILQTSIDKL